MCGRLATVYILAHSTMLLVAFGLPFFYWWITEIVKMYPLFPTPLPLSTAAKKKKMMEKLYLQQQPLLCRHTLFKGEFSFGVVFFL